MIIFLVLLIAEVLSGCSTTATLFPVDGPMSKLSPLPVLTATVDGITGNTGDISLVMPDGEICKGRWSSIAPMSYGHSTASAKGSATNGMASVWATVHGSEFYMANVPGVNKGEAVLVGDRGIMIESSFILGVVLRTELVWRKTTEETFTRFFSNLRAV